jgi:hypothetical protein
MDTKRKIILALGFSLNEKLKVFLDDDEDGLELAKSRRRKDSAKN